MKRLNWPAVFIALSVLSGILLSRCGDSGTPAPQPGTVPSAVPSASPAPSPSPSPSQSPVAVLHWANVLETRVCPFPDCLARDGFQVFSNGHFIAEVFEHPPRNSGFITPDELNQLGSVAEAIANALGVDSTVECQAFEPALGESSVRIELQATDGSHFMIFDRNTETRQMCYSDGFQRVTALRAILDNLIQEYDPGPVPTPSQSPSPTPSVSPQPSPSPSESPSPGPSPSESPSPGPSPSESPSPGPSPSESPSPGPSPSVSPSPSPSPSP